MRLRLGLNLLANNEFMRHNELKAWVKAQPGWPFAMFCDFLVAWGDEDGIGNGDSDIIDMQCILAVTYPNVKIGNYEPYFGEVGITK